MTLKSKSRTIITLNGHIKHHVSLLTKIAIFSKTPRGDEAGSITVHFGHFKAMTK